MNRSTLTAGFSVSPAVVNGVLLTGMNPWPATPRAPQPWVMGDVTSDSVPTVDDQDCGSSKPNSRSRDGAVAQALLAAVAGVPGMVTDTVTGSGLPLASMSSKWNVPDSFSVVLDLIRSRSVSFCR